MKLLTNIIIAMFTFASIATAGDNTLGRWKYNAAKSNPAEGQRPYNSLIITRESTAGGVRQTVHVEDANGTKADGVYTAKYDGIPVNVKGNLSWDRHAEKQIDANTISQEDTKEGSDLHIMRRVSVSDDGRTMTVVSNGTTVKGEKYTQMSVLDKL